jgi:SAM-dependent methyltransferase
MASGRVLHGRQYLDDAHRRQPSTYYVRASGISRALEVYRSRPDLRVGVVGLGAGTLAAYGELPIQSFRFYEINPEVIRLARTRFTFLQDCPARVEVVPGDARLSLEREPAQGFHVLVLDAFSGDTVPTHLLTAEAFALWLRHLAPDGTIAVHVSNRYLDLEPVVRGVAGRCGLRSIGIELAPPESEDAQASFWMLCTRNEAALAEWTPHASKDVDPREIVWTDDASDLFSVFRMRRGR